MPLTMPTALQKRKPLFSLLLLLLFLQLMLLAGCGLVPARQGDRAVFSVAFVSEKGLSLFRQGGEPALLLEGGHFNAPLFSLDGQSLFFNQSSDLFVLPLTGESGKALVAANARAAGFDRQGRLISLSEAGAAAYTLATGESEALYTPPEGSKLAAFLPSPDETRLAYTLFREDAGQKIPLGLFVTAAGAEEALVFSAEDISGKRLHLPVPLAWATDGSALLVAAGPAGSGPSSLYLVPVIDGTPIPLSRKFDLLFDGADLSFGGGQALTPVLKNKEDAFQTLLQIDLFSFDISFLHTATGDLTGTALSPDGAMAAYTAENAGLFTLWSGKTAQIAPAERGTSFFAPVFSKDRQSIYVLRQGAETAAFCKAPANSAGLTALFTGVLPPNEAIGQTYAERFAVFEP